MARQLVGLLSGMHPNVVKGEWVYLHSTDMLQAAGLQTLEHYTEKGRQTIAKTIRD